MYFSFAGLTHVSATGLFDNSKQQACAGATLSDTPVDCSTTPGGVNKILEIVLQLLSLIGGIAAVIMIIISGIKYITSTGDPSSVNSAKNALLYAIIGLVVVVTAQVIVRFVLKKAG